MNIFLGDKVRFLNEIGGGLVSKIEGQIVFVEDEDGFEIPVPYFEVVKIESATPPKTVDNPKKSENEQKNDIKSVNLQKKSLQNNNSTPCFDIPPDEHSLSGYPVVCLGFITASQVLNDRSMVDIYIVNNSQYSLFAVVSSNNGRQNKKIFASAVEPNSKVLIDTKTIGELNFAINTQIVMYSETETYDLLPPIEKNIKLETSLFLKRNAFTGNDYFFQSAMIIRLNNSDFERRIAELSVANVMKNSEKKEILAQKSTVKGHDDINEILEVDLHFLQLVDDSSKNYSNFEMLSIQLKQFHATMEEYKNKKGKKIVFIHGVGNGILKNEICKQLETKYKGIYYQDASFKEYGFGATMITI